MALLIVTNLVPLFGALFLGWDVPTILFTYWLENGIVGLLNVPKMVIILRASGERLTPADLFGTIGFFIIHYGIFWLVHGMFVMLLTGQPITGLLDPFRYVASQPQILFAAALLFVSHLTSFFVNFVGKREYLHTSVFAQAFKPYPRMVVLQLTVLIGGFAIWAVGEPVVLVALLVIFKTLFDLAIHLITHANATSAAQRKKGPKGIETTRAG